MMIVRFVLYSIVYYLLSENLGQYRVESNLVFWLQFALTPSIDSMRAIFHRKIQKYAICLIDLIQHQKFQEKLNPFHA